VIAGLFLLVTGGAVFAGTPLVRRSKVLEADAPTSEATTGLLILSHGAPSPAWNEPVVSLVERVGALNSKQGAFRAVECSFLEFAQPDAVAGIEKLVARGCRRLIVVPLFIAPSSHSHFDVPAVLGLYSSPDIRATLRDVGARIADSRVPVTLTQTLSEGVLLDHYALAEVQGLSTTPRNEAVVVLAHGCPDHHRIIERAVKRVGTYCCGRTGIDYGDWAYCAVGQNFFEAAAGTIAEAAKHKKRVLVVGLYVSSSAKSVYERALRLAKGTGGGTFRNPLVGIDMALSDKGLVHHAATVAWILDAARGAAESLAPQR